MGPWQEGTWVSGWGTRPPGALFNARGSGRRPTCSALLGFNLLFGRLYEGFFSAQNLSEGVGSKGCYRELVIADTEFVVARCEFTAGSRKRVQRKGQWEVLALIWELARRLSLE